MIYFAQINNKWAASTLIILIVKIFEFFENTFFFEEKTFVKENKEPFEIFRNISFFIRNPIFPVLGPPQDGDYFTINLKPKLTTPFHGLFLEF
jgi:hypothetical protein